MKFVQIINGPDGLFALSDEGEVFKYWFGSKLVKNFHDDVGRYVRSESEDCWKRLSNKIEGQVPEGIYRDGKEIK